MGPSCEPKFFLCFEVSSLLLLVDEEYTLQISGFTFHGSHHSWQVLESPGILVKFWKSPGKVLGFLFWSDSSKERFLSKHHFAGFLCMLNLAVHWLTALIFIWVILGTIMSIYTQHITGWRYSDLPLRA